MLAVCVCVCAHVARTHTHLFPTVPGNMSCAAHTFFSAHVLYVRYAELGSDRLNHLIKVFQ